MAEAVVGVRIQIVDPEQGLNEARAYLREIEENARNASAAIHHTAKAGAETAKVAAKAAADHTKKHIAETAAQQERAAAALVKQTEKTAAALVKQTEKTAAAQERAAAALVKQTEKTAAAQERATQKQAEVDRKAAEAKAQREVKAVAAFQDSTRQRFAAMRALADAEQRAAADRIVRDRQQRDLFIKFEKDKGQAVTAAILQIGKEREREAALAKRAMMEGDKVRAGIHRRALADLEEQSRMHRRVANEKPGVQTQGLGVSAGILGRGRNLISSLPGGGGMIGGMMSGGTMAAGAGIGAAVVGVKALVDVAKRADDATDRMTIAFMRSGLEGAAMAKELDRATASAAAMGEKFGMSRFEVMGLQATITGMSGITGRDLDRLTQIAIGTAEALDMDANAVARMIAKGADEEQQGKLAKLGVIFDENATAAQRLAQMETELGRFVDATAAASNDAFGAWDRLGNKWEDLAVKHAPAVMSALSAVADSLRGLIEGGVGATNMFEDLWNMAKRGAPGGSSGPRYNPSLAHTPGGDPSKAQGDGADYASMTFAQKLNWRTLHPGQTPPGTTTPTSGGGASSSGTSSGGKIEKLKRSPRAAKDAVAYNLEHDIEDTLHAVDVGAIVSTASTGHSKLTSKGNKSRHHEANKDGSGYNAVDISVLIDENGKRHTHASNPREFKRLGDLLAQYMVDELGYKRNVERGNAKSVLWQMKGHYDHLHISNRTTNDGSKRMGSRGKQGSARSSLTYGPDAGPNQEDIERRLRAGWASREDSEFELALNIEKGRSDGAFQGLRDYKFGTGVAFGPPPADKPESDETDSMQRYGMSKSDLADKRKRFVDDVASGALPSSASWEAELAGMEDKLAQRNAMFQVANDALMQAFDMMFGAIKSGFSSLWEEASPVVKGILDLALSVVLNLVSGGLVGGLSKALFGYSKGGFTGRGNPRDPAGIVHKGEYVVPADVVKRVGIGTLDTLSGKIGTEGGIGSTTAEWSRGGSRSGGLGGGRTSSEGGIWSTTAEWNQGMNPSPWTDGATSRSVFVGQGMDWNRGGPFGGSGFHDYERTATRGIGSGNGLSGFELSTRISGQDIEVVLSRNARRRSARAI